MSQVDTENTMESESSPQRHLENVNRLWEINRTPLNSPTTSLSSVITISDDSYDENIFVGDGKKNYDDNVIVITDDSDDENSYINEKHRELMNRHDRRLKCRIRRAINILLNYNNNLSVENISYLENKKYETRRGKNIRVVKNVVNRVSRIESERPRSEKQILRGLQTLRRRYIEAFRTSYEILKIWLSHDVNVCNAFNNGSMDWMIPYIINDNYISVARGLDGEVLSNDLDYVLQEINFSDSESSSCESEISSSENDTTSSTSSTYFDDGEKDPSNNEYYMTNKSYNQNIRLQRHKRRLKRRQKLRDRLKISQLEPGSSAGPDNVFVSDVQKLHQPPPRIDAITPALDDEESRIKDELPCRRNSKRIVETNSLSSETATSSSHVITNNLLRTPVMQVQRRSRSRTRNHSKPLRFCTVSPPSSRASIISQEQMRGRSRSPLNGRRSPTRPLVPTIPRLSTSQLPRSHSADTITATDISASTVTTTTAGRPHLLQSPPEALGSTLQRVLTDDDGGASASATLSQVALTLLELSEQ